MEEKAGEAVGGAGVGGGRLVRLCSKVGTKRRFPVESARMRENDDGGRSPCDAAHGWRRSYARRRRRRRKGRARGK